MRYFHAVIAALVLTTPAQAATIASSDFTTGTDGWHTGQFTSNSGAGSVSWDAANGWITTADQFDWNAFVAPAAYLGNQSGAFGGTIEFDLADAFNDAPTVYSAVALISGGTAYYSVPTINPSTVQNSLTHYSIALTGANFGIADAQLQSVLSALDRLAINADWKTGEDFVTLDNVQLSSGVAGAVPEPATWAMMIAGFGMVGAAMRRHTRAKIAFA